MRTGLTGKKRLSLSVIVPTLGRPGLGALLESCQPGPDDEIIVVGDLNGDVEYIGSVAHKTDCVKLIWSNESSVGGTALRNFAMERARGDYLVFNDDTDIFTEGALEFIRETAQALPEPKPLLFCVDLPGCKLWGSGGPSVDEGAVDGHQFVPPNIPDKLGKWALNGHGDYYFIRDTLEKWGGAYVPIEHVIATCAHA